MLWDTSAHTTVHHCIQGVSVMDVSGVPGMGPVLISKLEILKISQGWTAFQNLRYCDIIF